MPSIVIESDGRLYYVAGENQTTYRAIRLTKSFKVDQRYMKKIIEIEKTGSTVVRRNVRLADVENR